MTEQKTHDLSAATGAYMSGFGNEFATEARPRALPIGQNSPQKHPLGLYAEQLSNSAFTAPRSENRRSWVYRLRPSAAHPRFDPYSTHGFWNADLEGVTSPNRLRWKPFPPPEEPTDFVDSVTTLAVCGDPALQAGSAVNVYCANRSMVDRVFFDADGELVIVPQEGGLRLVTELGVLAIAPGEIAVIPRGIRFRAELGDEFARGYICENYGAPLRLPALGPIGSNGLAAPRDFLAPVAAFEDIERPTQLIQRFLGRLWTTNLPHSPLDVVGWHGSLAPYKYDLSRFNAIGTVSFDHPDPSIFTVLTSPSEVPGTANVDFVIFPPRWMIAEHTFRPPWYHRNIMSEFMGLIHGQYDAKADGFEPGGASLHNCMSAHGPDALTYSQAIAAELKPQKIQDTMAFMFESRWVYHPTRAALQNAALQTNYDSCWSGLKKQSRTP